MKYLILPTAEAKERNSIQSDGLVSQWLWESKDLENGTTALFVNDGQGLSEEELAACVTELPND
jgi:hypothetical protein